MEPYYSNYLIPHRPICVFQSTLPELSNSMHAKYPTTGVRPKFIFWSLLYLALGICLLLLTPYCPFLEFSLEEALRVFGVTVWCPTLLCFIPITVIKGLILKKYIPQLTVGPCCKSALLSNTASMLVAVPIVALILFCFAHAIQEAALVLQLDFPTGCFYISFIFICFFSSVATERYCLKKLLKGYNLSALKKATWISNGVAYLFMILLYATLIWMVSFSEGEGVLNFISSSILEWLIWTYLSLVSWLYSL